MEPFSTVPDEIVNFYLEGKEDPEMAMGLCLSIAKQRLFESMQYPDGDYNGFDIETLGLMKAFGINPGAFSIYQGGEFRMTLPESIDELQIIIGSTGAIDEDTIVDYIFRSSVQFVIDQIDVDRPEGLFNDVRVTLRHKEIYPAWIWDQLLDGFVYPESDIPESTMDEIMDVLAEAYVAKVAYDQLLG